MRRWLRRVVPIAGLLWAASAAAQPAVDAWVMSLNWSPEYCAAHRASKEPQCMQEHYFALGGLRPVFRSGDPDQCPDDEDVPNERFGLLLHLIPNKGQLKRVWREQGACSGLGMNEYFVQLDRARRLVQVPQAYRGIVRPLKTSVREIKSAFIEANPGLAEQAIALECKGSWLREVRVCLDRAFKFRACGLGLSDRCKSDIKLREMRASRIGVEPSS